MCLWGEEMSCEVIFLSCTAEAAALCRSFTSEPPSPALFLWKQTGGSNRAGISTSFPYFWFYQRSTREKQMWYARGLDYNVTRSKPAKQHGLLRKNAWTVTTWKWKHDPLTYSRWDDALLKVQYVSYNWPRFVKFIHKTKRGQQVTRASAANCSCP